MEENINYFELTSNSPDTISIVSGKSPKRTITKLIGKNKIPDKIDLPLDSFLETMRGTISTKNCVKDIRFIHNELTIEGITIKSNQVILNKDFFTIDPELMKNLGFRLRLRDIIKEYHEVQEETLRNIRAIISEHINSLDTDDGLKF